MEDGLMDDGHPVITISDFERMAKYQRIIG